MKGLMVSVIGMDCTNRGVTSGKDHAVLVWPGMTAMDLVFGASERMPLLEAEVDEIDPDPVKFVMRAGYLAVLKGDILSDVPPRIVRVRVKPAGKPHGMFGGHFVVASDSRFPFSGPVPVFDRYE